ncbi:HTH-type transcriptional regulator GlvR [Klebsiella pneumoniae]|nr:HTH-type transcriptional regulator GlvR [Klebsiella pneumoniae]
MDVENIFRDVKLSKTEMTVLRFIQNDPEQCIRQGVRAVAEQCYSNPSSLVRLAKKLKFSGWLELVYFIKFNITMPKLDVTNDIDYMSVQPEEALTPLLASLKQQRILIHGSGFSQLIAQYIYNKFRHRRECQPGAVARLRNPRTEKRRLLRLHLDHF